MESYSDCFHFHVSYTVLRNESGVCGTLYYAMNLGFAGVIWNIKLELQRDTNNFVSLLARERCSKSPLQIPNLPCAS